MDPSIEIPQNLLDNEQNHEETKTSVGSKNLPSNNTKTSMPYSAGVEALLGRARPQYASTKLRQVITRKKSWRDLKRDPKQLGLETFLIPKTKKKKQSTQFLTMGCSDSFSCLPTASTEVSMTPKLRVRSKKRIDKLMGKKSAESIDRSRLSSNDFQIEDDLISLSTLQTLKKKERTRLDYLKSEDMMLMSACDEDSALSVQSHITRRFRKRKALPLSHS